MSIAAPEVLVKIGGNDVAVSMGCKIGTVKVSLYKDGCSDAVIGLEDAYEDQNHGLRSSLTHDLLLGKKVEVSMGYAGSLGAVFSGYLEAVKLRASGEERHVVSLHACDAVKLLKENVRCRIFTEQSYSEVFTGVMKAYSWLCSTKVDDTKTLKEERTWQQDGSDYDFIVGDLMEHCPDKREFYVSLGMAYYREPDNTEKTVMTMDSDTNCIRFLAEHHYVNQTVCVQGYAQDYVTCSGEYDACGDLLDGSATKGMKAQYVADGDTQDHVDALAANLADRWKNNARQIRLSVPGKKELLPGKYVKIEEMDRIFNGTYQIWEAIHIFDEEGYQTEVGLGGC